MKKFISKTLLAVILTVGLVGCIPEKEPEVKGKYTIWIGGDIVQIGKQANEYEKKDGMITFRDFKTGKTIIVPFENLGSIEAN